MPIPTNQHGIPYFPALSKYGYHEGNVHLTYREDLASQFLRDDFGEECRFQALQKLVLITWPHIYLDNVYVDKADGQLAFVPSRAFNPWLRRMLRGFVNDKYAVRQGDSVFRFIGLTGVGAAGKTYTTGLYSFLWWAVAPLTSIVVQTSTTKDMLRSRIWSNIHKHWNESIDLETGTMWQPGHMVDSMMKLHSARGDAKQSISAYAVAHGETLKAIDNLKGLHAPRMLIVIDECNGTPEAILQVIGNYRKGCRDLTVIAIGNPSQHLDPHGRLCKPRDGWPLAMDDRNVEWMTEGVPEWDVEPGLCLRFDGRDSPNVKRKDNIYPHIYSYDDWRNSQAMFELHGGTFSYWTQSRGLWPPEGLANTVFTEQLFIRCEALDTHFEFISQRESYAFFDPAFGGDACIGQFGEVGDVKGGKQGLQLTDWMEVPIDPTTQQHDRDYQVARRIIEECKARGIKPHNVGVDATGTGRGVAAIIASEWSSSVHFTNWGVGCTDRPSSQNDGRPAREVYQTFVTEMYYSLREGVEAGQVKGFSREAVQQLCARFFELSGRKYKLETKPDMKARLRYSPDNADAVVGLWEIVRRNGVEIAGKVAFTAANEWRDAVKQAQDDSPMDVEAVTVACSDGGWGEADNGS